MNKKLQARVETVSNKHYVVVYSFKKDDVEDYYILQTGNKEDCKKLVAKLNDSFEQLIGAHTKDFKFTLQESDVFAE